MKQYIELIKKRKIFSSMFILTVISLILGILFIAFLSEENENLIVLNVNTFFEAIYNNKLNYSDILFKCLTSNLILIIIIWLLGISIIGIPIVLFILCLKSFILTFTFSSIIYTYKLKGIIYAIIYIIPHFLNLLFLFILIYYSLSFSKVLFNYFFRKKDCNRGMIVKNYLKLLIICIGLFIITSIIETFLVPTIIKII